MSLYVKYGNYAHDPGTAGVVSVEFIAVRSLRGFVKSIVAAYTVAGDIVATPSDTEYTLDAKIIALRDAYNVDGLDWGVYHTNNTPTVDFLDTDYPTSLTGNQIVYRSFPSGAGGEFATGREFAYKVQNEFLTPDSLILEYAETVSHEGTTGPKYSWHENKFQIPYYQLDAPSTIQRIEQQGHAITLSAYLLPPGPILSAPYELEHMRKITRRGPTRHPKGFTEYRVDWHYHYRTQVPFALLPRTR